MEIWETNNITVLFVTHSVTQAVYLSQRVVVLSSGPGMLLEDLAIEKNFKDGFEETPQFLSQVRHLTNILKEEGGEI